MDNFEMCFYMYTVTDIVLGPAAIHGLSKQLLRSVRGFMTQCIMIKITQTHKC